MNGKRGLRGDACKSDRFADCLGLVLSLQKFAFSSVVLRFFKFVFGRFCLALRFSCAFRSFLLEAIVRLLEEFFRYPWFSPLGSSIFD